MPTIDIIQEIELTAGGGTENLDVVSSVSLYIITGTATLTSNWTIQPLGTPVLGLKYEFKYQADIDLDGNDITIFGKTLPPHLADKKMQITAYYEGTNWEVDFLVDVKEGIPEELMENYNISDKQEVHRLPISFEAGEIGDNFLFLPYDGDYTVHGVWVYITKSMGTVDLGQLEFFDHNSNPMDIPNSAGGQTGAANVLDIIGTMVGQVSNGGDFSTNNTFSGLGGVKIRSSKTTPEGKVMLHFLIEKD